MSAQNIHETGPGSQGELQHCFINSAFGIALLS